MVKAFITSSKTKNIAETVVTIVNLFYICYIVTFAGFSILSTLIELKVLCYMMPG